MYVAFDKERKHIIRRSMKYGMLLSALLTLGYYDPESYTIIWKEALY